MAISAVLSVLAMALVIAGAALSWGTPAFIGAIALAVGAAALRIGALRARSGQVVTVEFTDAGYRITEPTTTREGTWASITKVTAAPGRLTFHQGEHDRLHFVVPPTSDADLGAIAQDASQRLDRDRGYSALA